MPSDYLDSMRAFRESLAVQHSAVTAVSQLTTGTSVVRDMLAVQNSLQMFNQWRALTGVSEVQRALRGVSEMNQRLNGWSNAVTAMSRATPDISALRSALAIPVGELRFLTDVPVVGELDDEVRQSLGDLSGAVEAENKAGAPSLLSDWLLWLPTAAEARIARLAAVALCLTMQALSEDTGTALVDSHIAVIVYALAAIATFLEGANRD